MWILVVCKCRFRHYQRAWKIIRPSQNIINEQAFDPQPVFYLWFISGSLDCLFRLSLSSISIDVGVSPMRLRVKDRMVRVPPGYQAELVIQLLWVDGEPPQQITSLDINSAYGL